MKKYDVVIIGGGVSGLSCAITLGSARSKVDAASDKTVLVIDAGKSHLKMAELHNVAGISLGTRGSDLLESMVKQATAYENISVIQGNVISIDGVAGDFRITAESAQTFMAELIVFANGMQTIDIQGIGAAVVEHVRAPRPGMVMIENINGMVGTGKYVTGCAAGATSMFASAAGYGAQTATDIISLWAGKYTVIHDVAKKS